MRRGYALRSKAWRPRRRACRCASRRRRASRARRRGRCSLRGSGLEVREHDGRAVVGFAGALCAATFRCSRPFARAFCSVAASAALDPESASADSTATSAAIIMVLSNSSTIAESLRGYNYATGRRKFIRRGGRRSVVRAPRGQGKDGRVPTRNPSSRFPSPLPSPHNPACATRRLPISRLARGGRRSTPEFFARLRGEMTAARLLYGERQIGARCGRT